MVDFLVTVGMEGRGRMERRDKMGEGREEAQRAFVHPRTQRASHVEKRGAHGRNSPSIRPQNVQSYARHRGKRDMSQRAVSLCEKSSQELKQRVRMSRRFLAEVQKEQQVVALNFREMCSKPQEVILGTFVSARRRWRTRKTETRIQTLGICQTAFPNKEGYLQRLPQPSPKDTDHACHLGLVCHRRPHHPPCSHRSNHFSAQ